MRKAKKEKDAYGQVRTKIFVRTLMMVAGAIVIVMISYQWIFFGHFSNWMIALFETIFRMQYEEALNLYQQTFRNYMDIIFLVIISLVFFVIFRIYLKWFTRYFGEINRGIDALVKEDAGAIIMSPELSATEKN